MKVKDILGSNPLKKRHRGPHRKPRYRGRDLHEGGAMAGVGAIHISEIEPTLIKLEKELGLNLRDFTLGSVGKKEFSGDIDIAINLKPEELADFAKKLQAAPSTQEVKKRREHLCKVLKESNLSLDIHFQKNPLSMFLEFGKLQIEYLQTKLKCILWD